MKKHMLYFVLSFVISNSYSQHFVGDSLLSVIKSPANDSLKIDAAMNFILYYQRAEGDSMMFYSKKILQYEDAYNNPYVKAAGYLNMGYAYYRISDESKLLEYTVKASEILDKFPNDLLLAYVYNFTSFVKRDNKIRMDYLKKAFNVYHPFNKVSSHSVILLNNIIHRFLDVGEFDSALLYANKSYNISQLVHDSFSDIFCLANLGNAWLGKGNLDSALLYKQICVNIAENTKQPRDYSTAYNELADFYNSVGLPDSSIYYYTKAFILGTGELTDLSYAAHQLYRIYNIKNEPDSVIKYMVKYIELNEKIDDTNKALRVQSISYEYDQRQEEKGREIKEKELDREHNLEMIIISIIILCIIVIFLVLNETIIVPIKFIRLLGVVILLVTFEFINLLLHPVLEKALHHSPALMLQSLVVIAAIITPVHHKFEHLINKIVAKRDIKIVQK